MRRTLTFFAMFVLLFGACGGGDDEPPIDTTTGDTPAPALVRHDGPPPWPLGDRQADRMRRAGTPLLKAEGSVVHYHAHLDVFYEGTPVRVPANIGIDRDEQVISPLHTHSASGVIHVEANDETDYTLGQFLTEWGVQWGDACIADKCGDEVAVFVNGSIQDEFAGDLVIAPHSQIALVLGTAPADIPSTYDCKAEDPGDIPCSD